MSGDGNATGSLTPVTEVARADDLRWRLQHMPALLIASAVLIVGSALVGLLVAGASGAAGAAAGVALVSLSYTLSTLVIAKADQINPKLILPWGMGTYIAKFSLIGFAMTAVVESGWDGLVPFGWGVIVGVVGWSATHIWWIKAIYESPVADRSSPSGREQE
jgi:hypothetical protein